MYIQHHWPLNECLVNIVISILLEDTESQFVIHKGVGGQTKLSGGGFMYLLAIHLTITKC